LLPSGNFLIVNFHVSKKENEIGKVRPITQNLQTTFNSNVYVKYIPSNVTEAELREAFSGFDV
jgi:RNA recognition motif-containing protein